MCIHDIILDFILPVFVPIMKFWQAATANYSILVFVMNWSRKIQLNQLIVWREDRIRKTLNGPVIDTSTTQTVVCPDYLVINQIMGIDDVAAVGAQPCPHLRDVSDLMERVCRAVDECCCTIQLILYGWQYHESPLVAVSYSECTKSRGFKTGHLEGERKHIAAQQLGYYSQVIQLEHVVSSLQTGKKTL